MTTVDYFKNAKEFVEFAEGQVIFDAGEAGDLMYAVKEGAVEIIVHDRVIETVEAGEFFGEMALIDHLPRSAKAVAKTASKIVQVDKDHFLFLVHETPTFSLQVMRMMANRLRAMNEFV